MNRDILVSVAWILGAAILIMVTVLLAPKPFNADAVAGRPIETPLQSGDKWKIDPSTGAAEFIRQE